MMLKIKKIQIENFRGIRKPVVISLENNNGQPSSALIYGQNGTGKSSIVDAWEWFNTGKIKYLGKEGVSPSDYPHKASGGTDCYLQAEFTHPTIQTVKSQYNKTRITAPTTSGNYSDFKVLSVYPNYLRYSDLQEFVYLTKKEKYEYIARFFGLEKFTKNQSDLQGSITRLGNQLQQYKNNRDQVDLKIRELTSSSIVNENGVVSFINTIAIKYSISQISDFKEAYKIKEALDQIVKSNPIAIALAEWLAFQKRLLTFFPIQQLKNDCGELETLFKKLKKSEENIKNLLLSDLYAKSIEVIGQLEDKSICPVCDQGYTGDLQHHITEKHKTISALNEIKIAYEKKVQLIETNIQNTFNKVALVKGETGALVIAHFSNLFQKTNNIFDNIQTVVKTIKTPLNQLDKLEVSNESCIADVDSISISQVQMIKAVADKIAELKADEKTKNLAADFTSLVSVINYFTDFLKADGKATYLNTICTNLDSLFTQLTTYIQNEIQTTFTAIQSDVADCFNALEGANPYLKNPEITLVAGKDKAVELEIEFVTEKITPAFKFMSESQINSFGLAIFLSAVKHFNNQFKFIILDDIVNSFDAYKRPKIPQLLASKFSDFQILMLTHDRVFFDTVQQAFQGWNRYRFLQWDYLNGPRLKLAKNYTEAIQELIDDDDPIKAGAALGRYFEWIFGTLCETTRTAVLYKSSGDYTLSDFYNPLVSNFNKKLKAPNKKHKINNAFDEFDQGTLFRNYCTHWKDEPTPFSTQEIKGIFDKWLEIEEMLYCNSCKTFVELKEVSGTVYVKCTCATLNLTDTSYFE
jgi:hypothetical protein